MNIYLGSTELNGEFLQATGLNAVYNGANVVLSPEIVETYHWSDAGTLLYKPGYKIKKVKISFTAYDNQSGWPSMSFGLNVPSGSSVGIVFRQQSQWGYSGYAFKYGGVAGFNPETAAFEFTSSSTSRTGGSAITEFDITGGTVKCGQTYGTWVQDTTFTTDSTYQARIQSIFESQTVQVWKQRYSSSGGVASNDLLEVTYEPI